MRIQDQTLITTFNVLANHTRYPELHEIEARFPNFIEINSGGSYSYCSTHSEAKQISAVVEKRFHTTSQIIRANSGYEVVFDSAVPMINNCRSHFPWSTEEEAFIIACYLMGYNCQLIAERIKRTSMAVQSRLAQIGFYPSIDGDDSNSNNDDCSLYVIETMQDWIGGEWHSASVDIIFGAALDRFIPQSMYRIKSYSLDQFGANEKVWLMNLLERSSCASMDSVCDVFYSFATMLNIPEHSIKYAYFMHDYDAVIESLHKLRSTSLV